FDRPGEEAVGALGEDEELDAGQRDEDTGRHQHPAHSRSETALHAGDVRLDHSARPSSSCPGRCYAPGRSGGGELRVPVGSGPSHLSTRTRQVWADGPCASPEVPTSLVSTFGLPATSSDAGSEGSRGSNQAPVA